MAETVGRAATWLTVFLLPWLFAPDEYGIVVLLATFEGLATGLLMLGQDRAVMWRVAMRPGGGARWLGAAVVVAVAVGSAGFVAIGLLGVAGFDNILDVPIRPHILLLLAAVICLNVNRIVLAFVRVAGRARDFARFRVASGVGRTAVTLGVAWATGSSVAFPLGAALGTVGGGWPLWRRTLRGARAGGGGQGRRVRSMVRYGAPLSVHALAGNSMAFVDRWIIGSTLGLAVVGSYGWYYMLGSAVAFVYAALNVYYEPAIYRESQSPGSGTALREYLGVCMIAAGVYSLVGVGVASLAGGLVPDSVQGDPNVARIVLIAHWFYPVYLAGNYLLGGVGRTMRVAAMSTGALVVVLAANLLLIPSVGAVGGAWATLAGTLSLVAGAGLMLRRLRVGARVLVGPTAVIAFLGAGALLLPGRIGLAAAAAGLVAYGVFFVRWQPVKSEPTAGMKTVCA